MQYMKNLFLIPIFFLLYSCQSEAQTTTVVDDFEGNGTISSWFGDNCNINIMDHTCDGKKLLMAGEDKHVHVYDDQTCQLITSMHSRGFKVPGH